MEPPALKSIRARRRIAARQRRHGTLKRRAVALSMLAFGLSWAIVFGQLVSGHDPVLTAKASAATPRPAPKPVRSDRPRQQWVYAVDPNTGTVVQVPVDPGTDPAAVQADASGNGSSVPTSPPSAAASSQQASPPVDQTSSPAPVPMTTRQS